MIPQSASIARGISEMSAGDRDYDWDFENAEVRKSIKKPRAVVSVSFSREDFERISAEAKKRGMFTSEYIRKMTLDQIEMVALVEPIPNSAHPSWWNVTAGSSNLTWSSS